MTGDRTVSSPPCRPACDLGFWSDRDLIVGVCPRCTCQADPSRTSRMLKARKVLGERERQ